MKKKIYLFTINLLVIFTLVNAQNTAQVKSKTNQQAQKVSIQGLHNLYKVNDSVYRSEQPDKQGFLDLEKLGIKTVLCLRSKHNDEEVAKGTGFVLQTLPMKSESISTQNIIDALRAIQKAKKPILVHCLHGSDRTGFIIAAYRIVIEGWTKEEAISELNYPPFAYNKIDYPNIVAVLNSLDVEAIRKELGLK